MSRLNSDFLTFWRWASIFGGLLLVVSGGFYFFKVSAKTETGKNPATQNLILGKIAFVRYQSGSMPGRRIFTSNADGSGQSSLPISTSLEPDEPAWSPDGTKIVFGTRNNTFDIFVINADGSGMTNLTNTSDFVIEINPTWSAAGKIAYERDTQIWVMNDNGSGQTQFPGITEAARDPVWSPDGTKLAYANGAFSGGNVWVINADGTNKQQLTTGGGEAPSWSPDGTKIVYKRSGGIFTINADGTNETPVTTNSYDRPSWSPDGLKIAFDGGGITTVNADGTNLIRIIANQILFPNCCDTINQSPAWQPVSQTPGTFTISGRVTKYGIPLSGATVNLTGTVNSSVTTNSVGDYQFSELPAGGQYTVSPSFSKHYFTPANHFIFSLTSNLTALNFGVDKFCQNGKCVRNGKIAFIRGGTIYTINPDGTGETDITSNVPSDSSLDWSPDGSNIVFVSTRDGNEEIYRMNSDGSNVVRLTNDAGRDGGPFYSPDGTKIVFSTNRDGNFEIYQMDANGNNPVRLTSNSGSDFDPSYTPDGSRIIFSNYDARKLFTMNPDGSNQQPLPGENNSFQVYESPYYSPDGSKIIYTYIPNAGASHPEIWTMNADGSGRVNHGVGRSGTFSPDMSERMYVCCDFEPNINPARIRLINMTSGSMRTISSPHPSNRFAKFQTISLPHPAPFDFDGDGRSDVSVFRPSNGAWYINRSTAGLWVPVWGTSDDKLVPADYDGDQKTDVAVWRPADGNFYILNSFNNTVRVENFGLAGDIPTGGDWDGDGKADPAVYRPGAQSYFYYRGSMGNPQGNITFTPWGITGDKPVAGDYDGDGRADAAVYRNGIWYILQSSNLQFSAVYFGEANDTLVPSDYDGDGKTDPAVYRGGIWYLLKSTQGFSAFQFGISTDKPVAGDYDGDGRADAAVYRNGQWWIWNSQNGTVGVANFGLDTDSPIPSAFVR